MERFCEPNMPRTKVRKAFISQLLPEYIEKELNDMLIKTYRLGKSSNMSGELAYHPDILINNFRKGLWICESNAQYIPKNIPRSIIRESETELNDLYPYDCPFNNFRIAHSLVCGKSADYLIKAYAKYEEYRTIFVPQNYTKCCTIPVTNNAIITCDYYIGKIMRQNGFDVLTLEDTIEIGLRGYSHGLIGGCAAKLSNNLICFMGDIDSYKYGDDIRSFCNNYGVDIFSLSNDPLYDYGGILPITEQVPLGEESTADNCDF